MSSFAPLSRWHVRLRSIQDFPYAPNYTYAYEIAAIDNASFLSTEEKAAMYGSNYKALFA